MFLGNKIIFLIDKSGSFRLRSDIKSFYLDERTGKYRVVFKKGETIFHYNPCNVDVAEFTRQLEPPFRITKNSNGEVLFNVLGIRVFEGDLNRAYRVSFENGDSKDYPSDYLSIEEHIDDRHSINVWQYLNEVAKYNVIPLDDEKTISLADKYAKMEFVTKNSLLEAYLNSGTYCHKAGSPSTPIFPFGCNRSQYKAVRNALENKLSVIQGPPGTGKTQTILNIMANLLLEGKTMQIVSNNNSAVENVKEKLEEEGIGFLCAQLGKLGNKKEFIVNQSGKFPQMDSWKSENAKKARFEVYKLSAELQESYECKEKLSIDTEKLDEYKRQLEDFPKKFESRINRPVKLLLKFFLLCSREMERKHQLSWLTKTRLRLHRLPADEDAADKIEYLLTKAKCSLLEKRCNEYKEKVKSIDLKNKRLKELSLLVLKDCLYEKFGSKTDRKIFTVDEIFLKSGDFLKEYPLVLSTTFSATSNVNPAHRFDYLIMDEASQVDIAAGALALSSANNAVIVGDLKQLPNVVDDHTEEIVSAVFAKYEIPEAYRYSTNSFLSSVCRLYPEIPQTLLREHYRCNPLIIGFCSKQFYNGELIPMKKEDTDFAPIRVVRTVKGNHARGTVNLRQVETITKEILPALEEQFTDIGIISPYNNQADAIHDALEETGKEYISATVHKFQGREKDAIILSTVDNYIQEFTDNPHLLNVAVSRAKKQFTLVVSANEHGESNIQNLIDYIEYYQGKSEQSKISSVFDLLYKDYTQELLKFYKTHKRVSQFDSENLMFWTIQETMSEYGITHLGTLLHYPLRHLITSSSVLSAEQRAFANRPWTHIDFLIYDTVSHKAKLAIEVDGTQYHKADSVQGHRDALKDEVLQAIGLPLLRLSTAGSLEKDKIAHCLTDLQSQAPIQ